jgi:hypothetical protein
MKSFYFNHLIKEMLKEDIIIKLEDSVQLHIHLYSKTIINMNIFFRLLKIFQIKVT